MRYGGLINCGKAQLVETIDVHAQGSEGEALVHRAEVLAGTLGKEQWQQMLGAWMVAPRLRCLAQVVVQRRLIALFKLFDQPIAEGLGPRGDHFRASLLVQLAKVMGDAAGADQQYVLLTQAGQNFADAALHGRAELGGQGQLYHGYIGLRIQQ